MTRQVPEPGQGIIMWKVIEKRMKEKMDGSMFIGTWWSLVPPLLAIVLAFLTKEVYSALFVGVAVGALLYTGFSPWDSFVSFFEIMKDSMNLNILIFDVLLGMIIVLMAKSGGSAAYGNWAGSKIKSKKSALLATTGLGVLIFVDDYFNCLTVGSVMRPVTDRYKVSRAKLAYIIDSTAAPVCIIAPISSWAAAVNSYVPDDAGITGFQLFLRTIPYNLYALLTLAQVNQLLQMMELFQNMPADNPAGFSPDLLMGMLNPEQKEMFQTYDAMFSDTMNQMDFTTSKGGTSHERMDESSKNAEHGSNQTGTD